MQIWWKESQRSISVATYGYQDGLALVTARPHIISGYERTILTPNVNEYKRLCEKMQVNISRIFLILKD